MIGVSTYGDPGSESSLTVERTAILGDPAVAKLRAGIMGNTTSIVARGLAIPWAQGVGIGIAEGTLDLADSRIANVAAREGSGEGILFSEASGTVTDTELAGNERAALIGIGGSSFTATRLYVHGDAAENPDVDARAAVFAFSTQASFEGCLFDHHDEGIVAGNAAVLVGSSSFFGQRVALRAMAGMSVVDDATDFVENAIAVAKDCKFEQTQTRTSLEDLPDPPVQLPSWK